MSEDEVIADPIDGPICDEVGYVFAWERHYLASGKIEGVYCLNLFQETANRVYFLKAFLGITPDYCLEEYADWLSALSDGECIL